MMGAARTRLIGHVLLVLVAGLFALGTLSFLAAPDARAQSGDDPLAPSGEPEAVDLDSSEMNDLMGRDDPEEEKAGNSSSEEEPAEEEAAEEPEALDADSPEMNDLMGREDEQDGATDDGSDDDEDGATGDEPTDEEDEAGSSGGACPSTGIRTFLTGGLDEFAVNTLVCMLDWVYIEAIQAGGEEVSSYLAETAFGLPSPEGEMLSRYDQMVSFVKPGILVGILALGVMMMVQSANYNVAYGAQTGLPKLAFAAGALIFFPELMRMVSDLSGSLATQFIGEAELRRALSELIGAGFVSGGLLSPFMILAQIAVVAIGGLVVAVAIMKNIFFAVLFIVGPLAMILSVVPGMANVASAWIRGVVACAAIPLLYALEVTIGSWAVRTPEMIFGSAGGVLPVFKVLGAVALMYIMWKTPFKVIGWAFASYSGPNIGSGMIGSIAKGVAVSTIAMTIGGALTGGPAGAAAGAATGAASGAASGSGAATTGAGASAVKPSVAAMQQAVGSQARNLPSSSLANSQANLMADVQRQGKQARAIRSAPVSMSSGTYSYNGGGGQQGLGLTGSAEGGATGGSSRSSDGDKSGTDSSSNTGGSGNSTPDWQASQGSVNFRGYRAHILERKPNPSDDD